MTAVRSGLSTTPLIKKTLLSEATFTIFKTIDQPIMQHKDFYAHASIVI
jgi:hypothetical protein